MADVKVKRIDELEGYEGMFLYAGRGLGVTSWGMNVLRLPAGWSDYPEHDHAKDGQEEVYVVLEGSAELRVGEERWHLERGVLARVGPAERRRIVPGDEGATILVLGGTPGQPYRPPAR